MRKGLLKHTEWICFGLIMVVSLLLLVPHLLFGPIITPSFSLIQFGPALGMLLATLIFGEKGMWRNILYRFRLRGMAKWTVLAFALTVLTLAASGLLLSIWGKPFVPWAGTVGFYAAEGLAMLFGCAAEEIGWRGLLLPRLRQRHSLFTSSLILGVVWGIWHLNFTGGIVGFLLYTACITMNSLLYSWFYVKSQGNLTVIILLHFGYNLFSHIILWNRFGIEAFAVETVLYGVAALCVVLHDKDIFFRSSARQSSERGASV